MDQNKVVKVGFIGCGGMARHHITTMLQRSDTQIAAICEPSAEAYTAAGNLFKLAGLAVPPNEPDWKKFIAQYAKTLDAVFIVTPHALHFEQAKLAMETGLDVLLEKPMVMNAQEATALIDTRDKTGRLLVVAFQGSLSPQVRAAVALLRSGKLGSILNINAMAWQNWGQLTVGTWRQHPELSGGGFLFDTGAHMLNTVADLAGEDFIEVAAWMENDNYPVDIRAVAMARLASGGLVTFNGCGSAIPSCHSDIRVFCSEGIIRTGIWGEQLELQRHGAKRLTKVKSVQSIPVWEQFLNVRNGVTPNPSPPEVGLRMARLWDAIKASAALNGKPVKYSS